MEKSPLSSDLKKETKKQLSENSWDLGSVCLRGHTTLFKENIFLFQIIFFIFLNYFDMLMLKIKK